MELNLQIMTYGYACGKAAHDFWKSGRGHTNKSRFKICSYEFFFSKEKKKVLGKKQNSFKKECLVIDYCTCKCIVLVRDSLSIIQMRILKPPYETSFFFYNFFCRDFFSNVIFAIRASPLTFYEIL